MKKTLFTLIAFCMMASFSYAQEVFSNKNVVLNAGIGLGTSFQPAYSSMLIPPLSLSGEISVVDNLISGNNGSIGVGGYVGFASFSYHSNFNFSYLILGVRGAFHYQFVEKLDTYLGLMITYNLMMSNGFSGDAGSPIWPTSFLGARYYFNPNIAGFLELGYGVSSLNIGVAFKL